MGSPVILSRSLPIAPQEKITGDLNSIREFSKFFAPPCTSCRMQYSDQSVPAQMRYLVVQFLETYIKESVLARLM